MSRFADNTVVLMTDFGYQDDYVGLMKGVLLSSCPGINIVDLTHDISPGSIRTAAFILVKDYRYFPENSLYICVVDPGVGTERNILCVKCNGRTFIAPDNGLLGPVIDNEEEPDVRIFSGFTREKNGISNTFHGRDIMAPIAADILNDNGENLKFENTSTWNKSVDIASHRKGNGIQGSIMHIDHYGNLITNIEAKELEKGSISYKNQQIEGIKTFGDGKENSLHYLVGSKNTIEIVVKNGSAKVKTGAVPGEKVIWTAS